MNDPNPDSERVSSLDTDSLPHPTPTGRERPNEPAETSEEKVNSDIPDPTAGDLTQQQSDSSAEGRMEDVQDDHTDSHQDDGKRPSHEDAGTLVERVSAAVEAFHSRAEHYEETNRLLHSRIESLQADQVRVLLKPVFERLATLQTQAADAAAENRHRDPSSAGEFEFFAISIDELLALYDVESVGATAGSPFDSKLHHGARIVPTADIERDGQIQRVQRQGFRYAGADRVMLPARVSVYRYAAPEPEPAKAPGSEAADS